MVGVLSGQARIIFLEGLLELLKGFDTRKGDEIVYQRRDERSFDATILFGNGGGERHIFSFTYRYSTHQVVEEDPGNYGDTPSVAAAARQGWYEGKTYTVVTETLVIGGMNASVELEHLSDSYPESAAALGNKIKQEISAIEDKRQRLEAAQEEETAAMSMKRRMQDLLNARK